MTRFTLDVAVYQGALLTSDVVRAGFDGVNLKTSHGTGLTSVHPDVAGWVTRARAAKLGISTFHWLTADASGAAQAVHAWQRLQALGLTTVGHVVDIEAPGLTWTVIAEYSRAMAAYLGRTVFAYSADWRWEAAWTGGSGLTPYLWAAPNAGYLTAYPGDTSAHWTAGYGGWVSLSVMQYAVQGLIFPDGTVGTIKVSKSAIRSEAVWTALTGGPMAWTLVPCLVALRAEFNAIAPARDKASDGSVGDAAHAETSSDHNPDETGHVPIIDADTVNEVHAIDVDMSGPWPDGWTMERFVQLILARCRAGLENRLRYIIYNRRIWSASVGWAQQAYTGVNPHDQHAHFSASYDSAREADISPWGLRAAVEDDMALTEADVRTLANAKVWPAPPLTGTTGSLSLLDLLTRLYNRAAETKTLAGDTKTLTGGVSGALSAYIAAEATDDAARAEALAELQKAVDATPAAVLEVLGDPSIPDEQIAASLTDLLGTRAAAVGALMQGQTGGA